MPREPGPRHTGDAPHASDAVRCHAADTPYDDATWPMTSAGLSVPPPTFLMTIEPGSARD